MTWFLDEEKLAAVDERAFRRAHPQPWCNPAGLLRPRAYRVLIDTLPEPALFEERFGVERAHGQDPHDRLVLEYRRQLPVADAWHDFIAELEGPVYQRFMGRMLGRDRFHLNYHWHYTPTGCSVSPHCDALHKIGSHVFYLNTEQDWRPEWGGDTLVLDNGGRLSRNSAPGFEDFDAAYSGVSLGNRSFLFARSGNLWHGVRPLQCPEGVYRKVFIVVINDALRSMYPRYIKPIVRALTRRAGR